MRRIEVLDTFDPNFESWVAEEAEWWTHGETTFVSLAREKDGWYTDAPEEDLKVDLGETGCVIRVTLPEEEGKDRVTRAYYFYRDKHSKGKWYCDGTDFGPVKSGGGGEE